MTDQSVSCIIPFWNEGRNIINVLEEITLASQISEIICVDDASDDNNHAAIPLMFPGVKVIRLNRNYGKSGAIREGLNHAAGDLILMIDADLQNLDHHEIEVAIETFRVNTYLDMLILRRINAPFYIKSYRADILFSGERILRKTDLSSILINPDIRGWQLESAINTWMVKNRKNVAWIAYSGTNRLKYSKYGVIKGLKLDLKTYSDMITANGFLGFIRQIIFFGREEIKPALKTTPVLVEIEEMF